MNNIDPHGNHLAAGLLEYQHRKDINEVYSKLSDILDDGKLDEQLGGLILASVERCLIEHPYMIEDYKRMI